jgi:hypothetical protein
MLLVCGGVEALFAAGGYIVVEKFFSYLQE